MKKLLLSISILLFSLNLYSACPENVSDADICFTNVYESGFKICPHTFNLIYKTAPSDKFYNTGITSFFYVDNNPKFVISVFDLEDKNYGSMNMGSEQIPPSDVLFCTGLSYRDGIGYFLDGYSKFSRGVFWGHFVSGTISDVYKCENGDYFNVYSKKCEFCPKGEYFDVFNNKCTKNCEELLIKDLKGKCLCESNDWGSLIDFIDFGNNSFSGCVDETNTSCDLGTVSSFGYIAKGDNQFYESSDFACVLDCSKKSHGYGLKSPMCKFKYPNDNNPDNGNPDNGNPDNGNPDNGNPDNGNPDNGNPDNGNPDNGNPDNGKPDNNNPDGGGSGDNSQTHTTTHDNNDTKPDDNGGNSGNSGNGGNGKGDDFGDYDGDLGDLSKQFEERYNKFESSYSDLKNKIDSLVLDLNKLQNSITSKGFLKLNKNRVNNCSYSSNSINFGFGSPLILEVDLCKHFSRVYSIFYFITFLATLFYGIKFVFSLFSNLLNGGN